ncbi:histidine kinase A [Pseudocercospora fijiensis CIRAD86]|uniref:Histidine kinase A n=1 Tax=Pseudocercospora fijiensis (strain CIRAD86) TaxID=383855 RepID=N1QD01_PSEFD|nr:histidine kinase A [Pseudocercospora fijiensis CIRAD86]EME89523.1 histidine kinase A [Pseudocercospora fijiensis CIRAD86]
MNPARDAPSSASASYSLPNFSKDDPLPLPRVNTTGDTPAANVDGQLNPTAADRVFPIRSVVSVDPSPTPTTKVERAEGYFQNAAHARRMSVGVEHSAHAKSTSRVRNVSVESTPSPAGQDAYASPSRHPSTSTTTSMDSEGPQMPAGHQIINEILNETDSLDGKSNPSTRPASARAPSFRSTKSSIDETGPLVTARFKHVVTEGGHAIITGRHGETLQRCEDEPIHIPGAVQGFGLLIALEEEQEGRLVVKVVSENSKRLLGFTPRQLFSLDSFTDILSEEQTDNLLDHVDFIRDEEADVITNGPEVFTISIRNAQRKNQKFWCAMHINDRNPNLIICEFELEDDPVNPLVPPNDMTPEPPEDTLDSRPTESEFLESTQNSSKPLRVLRSARKRKGEAAAMEVFNIMSQVQEQLASATNLEKFLKILVGVVKELTGFHRVMIYQFDQSWNGRVVTELVDPRATKDLYKGLNFPASDIPKQARELYKINKVRMLYDRDHETARLVCRTMEVLETPLDLTYSYLRAMSPIHLKYLGNMAVRSSMSISINAFEELWGLIACHSYGSKGMRVSFPIRKMCRLVGDSASRNIERLSYASRLQARKLINTVPTQNNPSGYIIASSEDLLKLFDADFGLLSIRDETKILGHLEHSQEALAMLEYLRMRCITSVMTSQDIKEDFPDLRYPPGFAEIAGLLLVPLSVGGQDFIVFFRKGQLKEVKWAGNPYEKYIKEGTEGYLEPRKSFKTWSETVVGKCREWSEEEIETAAVLCLVYGKFIEVWRQKEAALQNSQLTRLLLANSAHEVRTPLNAIINYLEIALEGSLDQETRENLAKSHSASKSLIYVINDLLDLTKTEEGGELVKDEVFDLSATLYEATDMFKGDARRKNIYYEINDHPGLPKQVIGDQRRIRQAISNVTANAIQNTNDGGVKVDMYLTSRSESHADVEISIADTGVGMSTKKLDALFRELEQVQTESEGMLSDSMSADRAPPEPKEPKENKTLGLGLAVVARVIRNMNGQLRLKSEEGKGSRFVIQFPFELPVTEPKQPQLEASSSHGSTTPHAEASEGPNTPPTDDMMTLIERGSGNRRDSSDDRHTEGMIRKNSTESVVSRNSLGSARSGASGLSTASARSGKSEADRLIEAIQEPHRVDGWHENSVSKSNSRTETHARPRLSKRHTTGEAGPNASPEKTRVKSMEITTMPPRSLRPGETSVADQGQPIRPVRISDYIASPKSERASASERPISAPSAAPETLPEPLNAQPDDQPDASHLNVLVAEDDPVNSRIMKKRLEKLGHEVTLTVNGEECSSTYCDKVGFFDIVLMDMQMPIVDGLTSTKMIRSFEKSHPTDLLSKRAAMNGRVPVIAVSASLIERDRPHYIDGGFDGWILKPISFQRLQEIMEGIVDKQVRIENLYKPGSWERGGWFDEAQKDMLQADTTPSQLPPTTAPAKGVKVAAAIDDAQAKEEGESRQTAEQNRLPSEQEKLQNPDP